RPPCAPCWRGPAFSSKQPNRSDFKRMNDLAVDAARRDHRLGAAADVELLQYGGDVRLDGRLGHPELISDLLVQQAFAQHHEDTQLLGGKPRQSAGVSVGFEVG